jgi:carbon storage regulator
MLVLTRRLGETIVIDGQIRVTIVEICGNQILLGVEAPPEIGVDLGEAHARHAPLERIDYRFEHAMEAPQ